MRKLRIGVSACLLGREVRWDGGQKRDAWIVEELGKIAVLVPVCPEVEVGMGVPREPVRLVRIRTKTRMLAESGKDWTSRMEAFARRRVAGLKDLDGYILKASSPSCGLEGVKEYRPGGRMRRDGVGVFAAALRERLPLLPAAEEASLADEAARAGFVARVRAYARLKAVFAPRWTLARLEAFHAAEAAALAARDPAACAALGRIVARARAASMRREEVVAAYGEALIRALAAAARARSM